MSPQWKSGGTRRVAVTVNVNKLSMVYDADSGVRGEISYVFGMLRGHHCSLCDLSHARIRRKSEFADLTCSLPVGVEVLHRNEQDVELAEFTAGITPVIVAHTDLGMEVFMDSATLDGFGGDTMSFAVELQDRLVSASTGDWSGTGD